MSNHASSHGSHRLVILYGMGGLSDVGRHAVQVASDCILNNENAMSSSSIVVLTRYPELLEESNWKCGCPPEEPHHYNKERVQVVAVKDWKDAELQSHFAKATGVISCLGNRQPGLGGNEAFEAASSLILPAMQQHSIQRLVTITSVGIEEDWPALEFFLMGKIILSCMFLTCSRRAFRDLTDMERAIRKNNNKNLDFLLVRPVGIGEDVLPVGKWQLQKEKYKDKLDFNMAKLDVARFMVMQAMRPTLHRTAVVIGGVTEESQAETYKDDFLSSNSDSK